MQTYTYQFSERINKLLEKRRARKAIESVLIDYSNLQKSRILTKLAQAVAVAGLLIIYAGYLPSLYYWVSGKAGIDSGSRVIAQTAIELNTKVDGTKETEKVKIYQPKFDPTLASESRLVITTLGIDTPIVEVENQDYEEAMKKGVWRVNNFGTPNDRSAPTILAAHRYGYLKWTMSYRLENSFLKLDNLNIDETVEVIWNQRKYTYGVYKEELGEEITDYSADLILYTCKDLNSSKRIFKYARLLEI